MDDEKDMEFQNQEPEDIDGNEEDKDTEKDKDDPQYRGKVLMQRALKHLDDGEMEEFETDRALANKFFDEMLGNDEEMDALYNESRNFGIIYRVLEANLPQLMESKRGQKSLRRIVGLIKGDKTLHEQFMIYNNAQPIRKISNTAEYVNEALSKIRPLNRKAVKESNERLIRLMRKSNLNEIIDIDDDKLNLYEAIEYVTLNRKSLSNIDEYVNATNIISESIRKNSENMTEKATMADYAKGISTVSENIGGELNSREMEILKEVYGGNGEEYFNRCKNDVMGKLNEMMSVESDISTKSRLSQIYEKINKKSYSKENAAVDISEMMEIQDTIEE